MSTNTHRPTESQTTAPSQSTPTDAELTDTTDEARESDTADSWVARCQRQFDAGRTERLRNLADGENHAMP